MPICIACLPGKKTPVFVLGLCFLIWGLAGCASQAIHSDESGPTPLESARDSTAVDCLLPAQVKKLSGHIAFIAPRRVVRLEPSECRVSGGDFVARR